MFLCFPHLKEGPEGGIWVVYHLHEKTIWLEIVQMERKKRQLESLVRSMRFPFTVRPEEPEGIITNYKFVWN